MWINIHLSGWTQFLNRTVLNVFFMLQRLRQIAQMRIWFLTGSIAYKVEPSYYQKKSCFPESKYEGLRSEVYVGSGACKLCLFTSQKRIVCTCTLPVFGSSTKLLLCKPDFSCKATFPDAPKLLVLIFSYVRISFNFYLLCFSFFSDHGCQTKPDNIY